MTIENGNVEVSYIQPFVDLPFLTRGSPVLHKNIERRYKRHRFTLLWIRLPVLCPDNCKELRHPRQGMRRQGQL